MISAVILAAGASRRMGRPKPLIQLGRKTLLQQVVANLLASKIDDVVVVLGHRAEEILPTLRGCGCRVVINQHYSRGMSSSLSRGLKALHPQSAAVLVVLGDQPNIPPEVVDAILRAYRGERGEIVVPTYGGCRGHPVLFGRKYWSQLRALQGDVGGRGLLQHHRQDLVEVEVDCPHILVDIDRPEDIGHSGGLDYGQDERAGTTK